jgi:hypothetical protein
MNFYESDLSQARRHFIDDKNQERSNEGGNGNWTREAVLEYGPRSGGALLVRDWRFRFAASCRTKCESSGGSRQVAQQQLTNCSPTVK